MTSTLRPLATATSAPLTADVIGTRVKLDDWFPASGAPDADITGTVVDHSTGAVWVEWDGIPGRHFITARYLLVAAEAPAREASPAAPLTLTVDAETAIVEGTVKGDDRHAALVPRPWVWSRGRGRYVRLADSAAEPAAKTVPAPAPVGGGTLYAAPTDDTPQANLF